MLSRSPVRGRFARIGTENALTKIYRIFLAIRDGFDVESSEEPQGFLPNTC